MGERPAARAVIREDIFVFASLLATLTGITLGAGLLLSSVFWYSILGR